VLVKTIAPLFKTSEVFSDSSDLILGSLFVYMVNSYLKRLIEVSSTFQFLSGIVSACHGMKACFLSKKSGVERHKKQNAYHIR
jgi:hypothetical protein